MAINSTAQIQYYTNYSVLHAFPPPHKFILRCWWWKRRKNHVTFSSLAFSVSVDLKLCILMVFSTSFASCISTITLFRFYYSDQYHEHHVSHHGDQNRVRQLVARSSTWRTISCIVFWQHTNNMDFTAYPVPCSDYRCREDKRLFGLRIEEKEQVQSQRKDG